MMQEQGSAETDTDLLQLGSEGLRAALLGSCNHASVLLREEHGRVKHDLQNNHTNNL